MELPDLIASLRRPEAYPHPVDRVEVVQTHISAVFLAGERAYKVKKPVDLGFLDFTSLDKRRHFCQEEVRLNRRLAPGVYLGVDAITQTDGDVVLGGSGHPIEYAVRMERLPEDRTFEALLEAGALQAADAERLALRLAAFHRKAASGPEVSKWGGWDTVAGNARENFEQIRPYIGETVSAPVFDALERRTEEDLEVLRGRIDARAAAHVPRDTHGDLHLRHVYSFPGADPPGDLVIVDCIEFNERFRFADPVADMAFMVMDLRYRGRGDLADVFADAYFAASGDEEGRSLLPFYAAYRAVVRGKVDGFASRGDEIPEAQREAFRARARSYFLLALGILSPPERRPGLIVTSGLPGTGKSWLARWLSQAHDWPLISTDVTRKRLAGLAPDADARADVDQGIYSPAWTQRTYEACLDEARAHWFDGHRVVLDGTFGEERRRRQFLDAARSLQVPVVFLVCEAPTEDVRRRLEHREGDTSDADWRTYLALQERWEPASADTAAVQGRVDTSGSVDETRARALARLREAGLL